MILYTLVFVCFMSDMDVWEWTCSLFLIILVLAYRDTHTHLICYAPHYEYEELCAYLNLIFSLRDGLRGFPLWREATTDVFLQRLL